MSLSATPSAPGAATTVLAIPFALTGGNLLLWLLHALAVANGWKTEFHMSVAVWVGYIALFGTAVQTAVVMVVYLEEALHRKAAEGALTKEKIREAAMEGAVLRLRPKLMTVAMHCISMRKCLGNMGRIGRSMMRLMRVSRSDERPSRLRKPPGIVPEAPLRSM